MGDDYGDGDITFRCQRPQGHDDKHRETLKRGPIEWAGDDSKLCTQCGKRGTFEVCSECMCPECFAGQALDDDGDPMKCQDCDGTGLRKKT